MHPISDMGHDNVPPKEGVCKQSIPATKLLASSAGFKPTTLGLEGPWKRFLPAVWGATAFEFGTCCRGSFTVRYAVPTSRVATISHANAHGCGKHMQVFKSRPTHTRNLHVGTVHYMSEICVQCVLWGADRTTRNFCYDGLIKVLVVEEYDCICEAKYQLFIFRLLHSQHHTQLLPRRCTFTEDDEVAVQRRAPTELSQYKLHGACACSMLITFSLL